MAIRDEAFRLSSRREALTEERRGGKRYFYFERLSELGLKHRFSSIDSNLKISGRENLPQLKRDWEELIQATSQNYQRYYYMRQTHSSQVLPADGENLGKEGVLGRILSEPDGLMTERTDTLLSSSFGDCAPLLFLDPEKGVQANVHSGWRGTLANISGNCVRSMQAQYHCRPEALWVAIGPHIGREDFEVSEDVRSSFAAAYPELLPYELIRPIENREGKYLIDLCLVICYCLLSSGVVPEHILPCGRSTVSEAGVFHSFRRDKEKFGLMMVISQLDGRFSRRSSSQTLEEDN